jgi:hypothetical protein
MSKTTSEITQIPLSGFVSRFLLFNIMVRGKIPPFFIGVPIYFKAFSFMAGWPWPVVLFFFFLLTAFVNEFVSIVGSLVWKRFFGERRCRFFPPPVVCIFYRPKESFPGGLVWAGIFYTAAFILDDKVWRHELRHVKDSLWLSALGYLFLAGFFTGIYAKVTWDMHDLFISSVQLSSMLAYLLTLYAGEFFAYRADKTPLPTAVEKIRETAPLRGIPFKQGHFILATLVLVSYYIAMISPDLADDIKTAVAIGSALVFALVLRWALGVFTRRLFGIDVGDFLFSSFVVGAVLNPLLGVLTSFLFSWAMFGKARDAAVAAAVAAPSLLAVLLPGLVWTSVLLL